MKHKVIAFLCRDFQKQSIRYNNIDDITKTKTIFLLLESFTQGFENIKKSMARFDIRQIETFSADLKKKIEEVETYISQYDQERSTLEEAFKSRYSGWARLTSGISKNTEIEAKKTTQKGYKLTLKQLTETLKELNSIKKVIDEYELLSKKDMLKRDIVSLYSFARTEALKHSFNWYSVDVASVVKTAFKSAEPYKKIKELFTLWDEICNDKRPDSDHRKGILLALDSVNLGADQIKEVADLYAQIYRATDSKAAVPILQGLLINRKHIGDIEKIKSIYKEAYRPASSLGDAGIITMIAIIKNLDTKEKLQPLFDLYKVLDNKFSKYDRASILASMSFSGKGINDIEEIAIAEKLVDEKVYSDAMGIIISTIISNKLSTPQEYDEVLSIYNSFKKDFDSDVAAHLTSAYIGSKKMANKALNQDIDPNQLMNAIKKDNSSDDSSYMFYYFCTMAQWYPNNDLLLSHPYGITAQSIIADTLAESYIDHHTGSIHQATHDFSGSDTTDHIDYGIDVDHYVDVDVSDCGGDSGGDSGGDGGGGGGD